jgi:sugar phosphate isomerase/epimerase
MATMLICDDGNPGNAVPLCRKYGFGIEIQAFHDPALFEDEAAAIAKHLDLVGKIDLRAAHGCFGDLCPGSFDPMVRAVARDRFDLSYGIARKLGATHLILHHGYVPHTSPPGGWLRRCITFWKEFLADKDQGVHIHIENMLDWEPDLLADLIDGIGTRCVDANLDIGHVHCNAKRDIFSWILRLGKRIGYVHLHDNDGRDDEHLGLGEGTIPMKDVLASLAQTAPDALWAIESEGEGREQSIEWLIEQGFLLTTAH